MKKTINSEKIIELYNKGESMYFIAKQFGIYPTEVRRVLKKNEIELRHDGAPTKGYYTVKNGETLIEWAKSQGRLVTKTELANILGKKRLSHSYFMKYPELAQYIKPTIRTELQDYAQQLYDWLNENNISYKPYDKTALKGTSVHALLLDDYANIAIQIAIKSTHLSEKNYSETMIGKKNKAHEQGISILFLHKDDFKNLDKIKKLLDDLKHSKEG